MKEKKLVVCPYCGVGCRVYIETRDGYPESIDHVTDISGIVNEEGRLCPKGLTILDYAKSPERLTQSSKRYYHKM